MATVTAPTISKQQFIAWFAMLASFGTSALAVFDPSIHLSSDAKAMIASVATAVAGLVAGWYQHSSHKLAIAKIVGVTTPVLVSLPPQIPTT